MAARVNIRFLLILIILVGAIVGGVGAVVLLQDRSAADHIAKADELIEAGSLKAAGRQLESAIGKEPTNEVALGKLQDLYEQIVPQSQSEAMELFPKVVRLSNHRSVFFEDDAAGHRAAIASLRAAMRQSPPALAAQWWDAANDAAGRLMRSPDPDAAALGSIVRGRWLAAPSDGVILRADRTEAQREDGIGELRTILAERPGDDRARSAYLDALRGDLQVQVESEAGPRLRDASLETLEVALDNAEVALAEADGTGELPVRSWTSIALAWRAVAIIRDEQARDARAAGADVDERTAEFQRALERFKASARALRPVAERWALEVPIDDRADAAVTRDEYLRVVTEALLPLSLLSPLGEEFTSVRIAGNMMQRPEISGTARAFGVDLLSRAWDARRDDEDRELRRQRISAMDAAIERVLAMPPQPAGIDAVMDVGLRRRAHGLAVEASLLAFDIAEPANAPRLLAEMESRQRALETFIVDRGQDADAAPDNLYGRGLVSYARGDSTATASLLDRVLGAETVGLDSFQRGLALRLLGRMLEQEGSIARAADVYEQSIAVFGNDPQTVARLARARIRLGQFDRAGEQVERLEQLMGDGPFVEGLRRTISVARGGESDDPVVTGLQRIRELEEAGDIGGAMALAEDLISRPPANTIAEVHARIGDMAMRADDRERAVAAFTRAVELSPGNSGYQARLASASTADPIERSIDVAAVAISDPAERAVRLANQFEAELVGRRMQLERTQDEGERSSIEAEIRRFEEALAAQMEAARTAFESGASASATTLWMDRLLREGAQTGDWTDAEAFLEQVRRSDLDRAGGSFAEGQLMVARARASGGAERTAFYEQAVAALQEADDLLPFSATVGERLGDAQRQLGRLDDAIRAYESAVENDPSNAGLAQAYCRLLLESGQPALALQVATVAAQRMPDDIGLREFRLELELQSGNAGLVLLERRRIHEEQPADRSNATRYAYLLLDTQPTFATLVRSDGRPSVTPGEWARMGPPRQRERLDAERAAWVAEAQTIIDELSAGVDAENWEGRLGVEILRALAADARGDGNGAVRIVRDFVDMAEAGAPRRASIAAASGLLIRFRRAQEALDILSTEQQRLGQPDPAIQWTAAMVLRELGQSAAAAGPLRQALDASGGEPFIAYVPRFASLRIGELTVAPIAVSRDLVRALLQGGDVTGAREIWDAAERPGTRADDFVELAVLAREADAARIGGDPATADRVEQRFAALNQALIRDEPTDPEGWGVRIGRLVQRSRLEGRVGLLDDAQQVLDEARAAVRDPRQLEQAVLLVLEARGDLPGLVTELAGILEERPADDAVRNRLIDAYLVLDRISDAERVIRDAVDQAGETERSLPWRMRLGEFLAVLERHDEAAQAYAGALQAAGGNDLSILRRMFSEMLSGSSPNLRRVTEELSARESDMQRDPGLRAVLARSLQQQGRTAPAEEQFLRSLREIRRAIVSGDMVETATASWTQQVLAAFDDVATGVDRVRRLAGEELDPWMLMTLAQAWMPVAEGGMERSADLLATAIERVPDGELADRRRAFLRKQYGGVLVQLGRSREGLEVFERALTETPRDAELLNNTAFLQATILGEPEAALPRALAAVSRMPDNWAFLDTAGKICAMLERWDDAEAFLRRSMVARTDAKNTFHLAEVMAATDRRDEALRLLERASELRDSSDEDLRTQIDRLADQLAGG